MDIAADAVAEFITPPQQAAGAPQRHADGTTFEQHLRSAASRELNDGASKAHQAADNASQTLTGFVIAIVQQVAPPQPSLANAHGLDAGIVPQPEQAAAKRAAAPPSPIASAAPALPVIASAPVAPPASPQVGAAAVEIAPSSAPAVGATAAEAAQRPVTAPPSPQPAAPAPEARSQSAVERAPAATAGAPQTTAQDEAGAHLVAAAPGAGTQPPLVATPTSIKQAVSDLPPPNPAAAIAAPIVAQRQSLRGGPDGTQDQGGERLPSAPGRPTAQSARHGAAGVMTTASWSPSETSQPSTLASGDIAATSMTTQAAPAGPQVHAPHDLAARAAPAAIQVAREIVRRFAGESTHFDLRLDPPELGRVDVRLEVSRDHRVTAVVVADNPQALGELARHARDLEQTLQSAGLELSENGLSFDLRQGGETASDRDVAAADEHAEAAEAPMGDGAVRARPIGLERWRGVRLDMTV